LRTIIWRSAECLAESADDVAELFEALMLSFDLWGYAFAEKRYIGKRLGAMYPLDPSRMRVIAENGDVRFEYALKSGQVQKYSRNDILHVKNFSLDGINGLSPIGCLREVVGRGVDAQRFGANYLRNGGQPSGVLEHPKTLGDEARKKMRKDWQELHSGPQNSGNIAILWEDMKYKPISFNPEDLQYIELMKLTKAEIAEAYGVPLNLLAQADKTSTYASAEQFDLQFVKYTISPRCKRFEAAFKKSLLADEPGVYAKFNLDALLRGDAASRASFFSTMVQNGIMTRNEVRAKNDLDPIKGGDELTVQSNMLDLDKLSKLAAAPQPAPIVNA
jgi:HK97 family phage portal protein